MRKTLYSLLVLALGFTACDKEEIKDVPELPVEATMTRTLDFTLLGTEKDTTYAHKEKIKATALFGNDAIIMGSEMNVFLVTIDAGPGVTTDGAGDFVQFVIDPAKLKADYVGKYGLGVQADLPVKHIHYSYITNKVSGAYSARLYGTNFGNTITGELNITQYDAARNTISGTYAIVGKLYSDPTDPSTASRIDDECDLAVAGTFTNVKIKKN
ncbi:hypothetical protein [Flavisolibacter tropicus]|uniref:Uncharacterized protein n=1 Tax=Flavisolibacter tropicus TaxID=1492898 RepID=A0A172U052_9BACT|nr:hypothetical protein [Flavisolibacter tropicus]ANE52403.1 hypothetical protein SY85_19865 [Flavisolibacter tropicus]